MSEQDMLPSQRTAEGDADLQVVLAAWNEATLRLERTHQALRAEVGRLTDELEAKNRELARENRLADLGRMASHVAHEVRNNLVPVTLYLSLLRRRIAGDPQCSDVLNKIEAGFSALEVTVNDLLHFTSDRDPKWQTFCLADLLEELHASLAPQLSAQRVEVRRQVPTSCPVRADRDMLRRAVLNLMLNAVDVMPDGGKLHVSATAGPETLEIHVADTGPGMTEETVRRALEPFFTTKNGGTGLGLAIVHRIAEAHGGEVHIASHPEKGAIVTLRIPLHTRKLSQ